MPARSVTPGAWAADLERRLRNVERMSRSVTVVEGDDLNTASVNATQIRAASASAATLVSSSHPIQAGPTAGGNIAIGPGQIVARNNGAVASLSLNPSGGDVLINSSPALNAITGQALIDANLVGLQEFVDNQIQAHVDDAFGAHDASAIAFAPPGPPLSSFLTGTNVQDALIQLGAEINGSILTVSAEAVINAINSWEAGDPVVSTDEVFAAETIGTRLLAAGAVVASKVDVAALRAGLLNASSVTGVTFDASSAISVGDGAQQIFLQGTDNPATTFLAAGAGTKLNGFFQGVWDGTGAQRAPHPHALFNDFFYDPAHDENSNTGIGGSALDPVVLGSVQKVDGPSGGVLVGSGGDQFFIDVQEGMTAMVNPDQVDDDNQILVDLGGIGQGQTSTDGSTPPLATWEGPPTGFVYHEIGLGGFVTMPDGRLINTSMAAPPTDWFDVWQGTTQQSRGLVQTFYNVLGRLDPTNTYTRVFFTLNGGTERDMSLGPDTRRLLNDGDFIADPLEADLNPGANLLAITAETVNESQTQVVTINHSTNATSPPFDVDWGSAAEPNDLGQVIDGNWRIEAPGVRVFEPGYDRLLALGNITMSNYEVEGAFTLNQIDLTGFGLPVSGRKAAVGFIANWRGHLEDEGGPNEQPFDGFDPLGSISWLEWDEPDLAKYEMTASDGRTTISDTTLGLPPMGDGDILRFKFRQVTNGSIPAYFTKFWKDGDAEPADWTLTGAGALGDPDTGCFVLVAHHYDVTAHDLSFTEFVAGDPPGDAIVDDTFDTPALAAQWSVDNPLGLGTVVVSAGTVEISVPQGTEHDLFNDRNTVNRIEQPLLRDDFDIVVWLGSTPATERFPDQGITLEVDTDNWIRFSNYGRDTAGPAGVFVAITRDQVSTTVASITNTIIYPFLRVRKSSTLFTFFGSTDGENWTEVGVAASVLQPATFGVYAGTSADTPAHTTIVNQVSNFDTWVAPEITAIISDDFDGGALSGDWTFTTPLAGPTVAVAAGEVTVSSPASQFRFFGANKEGPILTQELATSDFDVVVDFTSTVALSNLKDQGIYLEQNASNWLRFDVFGESPGPVGIYAAEFIAGSPTVIGQLAGQAEPRYLRLRKVGTALTFFTSTDGIAWTQRFTHATGLSPARIGVFSSTLGATPAFDMIVNRIYNFEEFTP